MGELRQLLSWLHKYYDHVALLDSCAYHHDSYARYEQLLGFGCQSKFCVPMEGIFSEDAFRQFRASAHGMVLGIFAYDLKNQFEALHSQHENKGQFPLVAFFEPEFLIGRQQQTWVLLKGNAARYEAIRAMAQNEPVDDSPAVVWEKPLSSNTGWETYENQFAQLKKHIYRGDIYVSNYCISFEGKVSYIHPAKVFNQLMALSPAPFASFFKFEQHYLLSASMERYLARRNNTVISQPIKGTLKKTTSIQPDADSMASLRENPKEQQENVMIVDLVRNDLSRTALRRSVAATELFGVYPFSGLYQMISTVQSKVAPETPFERLLKTTFPMGSMTGAPKISAMQLAERYEDFMRGWYSGALGYIEKNGDFDLSVVIRSILYDQKTGLVKIPVGSAITQHAHAADEYKECMLKIERIRAALG